MTNWRTWEADDLGAEVGRTVSAMVAARDEIIDELAKQLSEALGENVRLEREFNLLLDAREARIRELALRVSELEAT